MGRLFTRLVIILKDEPPGPIIIPAPNEVNGVDLLDSVFSTSYLERRCLEIFILSSLFSQNTRYLDEVFDEIQKTEDVVYGNSPDLPFIFLFEWNTQNIDLRSDTVTLPSPDMLQAIASTKLGDDVFSEDPTVNSLQQKAANIMGKEDALLVPSGTMGNLVSIFLF